MTIKGRSASTASDRLVILSSATPFAPTWLLASLTMGLKDFSWPACKRAPRCGMTKGIFLYREDSRYEDRPWAVYQFPSQYLSRAEQLVGDWVIFMEPAKAGRKGYHAVAKVDRITPDPSEAGMFLAIIDPASYLDFDHDVPFRTGGDYPERSVLNDEGRVSGRAQAAVRPIPAADFNRIVGLGLDAHDELLPRTGEQVSLAMVAEAQAPYEFE